MSDIFTLIDLELPINSNMIECTNTQSFEEGENYASTISMEHLDLFHIIGYDMKLFGSDMILFGSSFKCSSNSCSYSHQFWCEKSSTASLFQNCCWGFDVNFLS